MKALLFLTSALVAVLSLVPLSALAQQDDCAPWPVLQEQLADRFGESEFFTGIAPGGGLVRVLAGPRGTWSVVAIPPGAIVGCIVGFGEQWTASAPPAYGEEG